MKASAPSAIDRLLGLLEPTVARRMGCHGICGRSTPMELDCDA